MYKLLNFQENQPCNWPLAWFFSIVSSSARAAAPNLAAFDLINTLVPALVRFIRVENNTSILESKGNPAYSIDEAGSQLAMLSVDFAR